MDRFSPSSPRSLSMNSLTSLPRSPMRASTLTSAVVFRAIIPRSVLFPTPLPAKIPILWPLPTVMRPSIDRMPTGRGSFILRLFRGFGGLLVRGYLSSGTKGFPSIGRPRPSNTLPIIFLLTPTSSTLLVLMTSQLIFNPETSS